MTDWTFRYGTDGIELNTDVDPTSPFVDIERVQGLSNAPYRTTEREREGMDGGFVDAEFESIRTIILEGTVYAGSNFDDLEPFMDTLKANYGPVHTSRPFYFTVPGVGQRIVFCKSYGVKYDMDAARRVGSSPIQIQLMAANPLVYSTSLIQVQTGLGGEDPGRAYNKSFNYGYGTPVTGGLASVENLGNRETDGILTIRGPITDPKIVHDETNRFLAFNIVLNGVQDLVIDLRNRSVLLEGTANRRSAMTSDSRWFLFVPGNNSLRFQGDWHDMSSAPILSVATRSAYR